MTDQRRTVLTDRKLSKLPPGDHADGKIAGLAFRVRETGGRSWAYRYRFNGRLQRYTLGPYPALGLAAARSAAREARKAIALGKDPQGEKRASRLAETFSELAAKYITEWAKPRKRTWKRDQAALKKYVLPKWRHLRIEGIERAHVKALLKTIPGVVYPNRIRALLSKVFAFAVSEDIIQHNPVEGITRASESKRDRTLTDDEVRSAWATHNPILKLILLTVQRPDDVKGMRWSEIADGIWAIPASRFKTGKAHAVPLVPTVIELLESIPRAEGKDEVFTQRQAKGLVGILKRAGIPDAKPKDLQRTARSRMTTARVTPDVAERVQGHVIPGVRSHYDTYDYATEKREALERWSRKLLEILDGEAKRGILEFRR